MGLGLVALTLFTSLLSYVLRTYSRSQLSKQLSESAQRTWLDRLDRHETELQLLAASARITAILLLIGWAYSSYFEPRFADGATVGAVASVVVGLALLLVVAVGIPNALANHAGESILAQSLWLVWIGRLALYPVGRMLMFIDFVVRRLLGKPETTAEDESERMEQEILDAVSEGEAHGAVDEEQKEIIESVFELHDTNVNAIMTPRTDVIAIQADATFDQARQTIIDVGHSRIPVYEESVDHIIGVLYAKDMIRLNPGDAFDLRKVIRTVPYVPEAKSIDNLLREFRQSKVHIAIVLDEYGGTAGLVTIEDILEELVGEIDDEFDRGAHPTIDRIDENTLEVDARVHVHEINEELKVALPEEDDYETIGGFVFTALGKIPAKGEEFTHENIHFHIVEAETRKINRLRIQVQRQAQTA